MKSVFTQIRYLDPNAFETDSQKDEYISSLRNRILPFKFAYIGRAAHTHDELIRSPEYGLADTEATLIRSRFSSDIIPNLTGSVLMVVDVGSGNGMKGALVLQELKKRFSIIRSVALDYSQTLLGIAKAHLLASEPSLNVEAHRIDIEGGQAANSLKEIRSTSPSPALFLFLGHTLGNPANRLQTLSNIRYSMNPGDKILVGIELYHPERVSEVLKHYQNEAFYQAIFNPLTFAGIGRTDGQIIISFDEATRDVVVHFELAADFQIKTMISGDIDFISGERLQIGISHRFEQTEIQELFSQAGLHVDKLLLDGTESYVLVLAGRYANV